MPEISNPTREQVLMALADKNKIVELSPKVEDALFEPIQKWGYRFLDPEEFGEFYWRIHDKPADELIRELREEWIPRDTA